MIPKIIHYCWFGGNPLPELAEKCIVSWQKYCPEYQVKRWDESNFDINCCDYVREAYNAKKWAFVSDYARLYVLVKYGGVYMDTDVEVIKNIDAFLNNHAFSGFEKEDAIPTGIMACEKDFPLFGQLLSDYDNRHFSLPNGEYDMSTNVEAITSHLLKKGLILNNTLQVIDGFALYPKDFFCPKNYETGKIEITENTCTIHHFSASWHSDTQKRATAVTKKAIEEFGVERGKKIANILVKPMYIKERIKNIGYKETLQYYVQKLKKEKEK